MTNGEKIKAILKPRTDQIRIYGDWVEIEIQRLGINFSCMLDWWDADYKEPTAEALVSLGVYKQVAWERDIAIQQLHELGYEFGQKIEPTKNDLGVDCISRQEVLRLLANSIGKTNTYLQTEVLRMSSVTLQEPKTGHWIANAPQYDMLNPQYICSECGNAHTRTTPYCEMCGAKMV